MMFLWLFQMVKMMITVVVIYALCWLPLHCITLVGDTHPSVWQFPHIQTIWIACHWLAMSNCCYNPIVYFWMNAKFRHGFRHALRWCPFVRGPGLQGAMAIYSTVNQRQTVVSFSPGKTRNSEAALSAKRFSMGGAHFPSATASAGSAVMSPYSARFQQRSCSSAALTGAESTRLAGKYHGYHRQVSMELDH